LIVVRLGPQVCACVSASEFRHHRKNWAESVDRVGSGALNPKQASSPGAAIGAVSAHPDAPAMQRVIAGG